MKIKFLFAFMLLSIAAFGQQNPIQIDANGLTQTLTAGGVVTRGQIVKINSAGQVVPVATTDTSGAIGVAATSQTSAGNGIAVSIAGTPLVQIDASGCAAGNIVSISTLAGGSGHCASTASGQQIGVALSISSPGSNFWNITLSLGGGGGGGAPVFSVKTYGAVGDAQHVGDGVTQGGSSKTVTSATANFQSTDVGKKIVCGAGNGGATFQIPAKILSVTATVATTDTSDTGAATFLNCVWYTQDDTSKFVAATTAASAATTSKDPNHGQTLLPLSSTVYCPAGGYAVSGRIFSYIGSAGNNIGPNFVGEGRTKCNIYVLPTAVDPNDGFAILINSYQTTGTTIRDFTVDSLGFGGGNFSHSFIQLFSNHQFLLQNVDVTNAAVSGFNGTVDLRSSANGVVDNVFVQGDAGGSDFACMFNTSNDIVVRNITCSNHKQNLTVTNTSIRSVAGDNGIVFDGGLIDECDAGTVDCAVISNNGLANFYGTTFMQGSAVSHYALNVDGTSRAYLSNVTCGAFGSTTATINCMTIASGGFVAATNSDFRGNDSNSTVGVAINGPAGATFVDLGGNKILHSVSGTISPVTLAQYGTLGFTGGIVPKSTQTHTPNTCYAVTGTLLATAQNVCIILLDQNYQLLSMTAQSGGTTPTNSSCATPPVITLSDGTRSATMTMTSGKTQWFSNVDAVTNINQVFASGATLTVSIGANTCATPPANVSVNYNLQSVLNP